jgi:hypothetical protein
MCSFFKVFVKNVQRQNGGRMKFVFSILFNGITNESMELNMWDLYLYLYF